MFIYCQLILKSEECYCVRANQGGSLLRGILPGVILLSSDKLSCI